MSDVLSPRDLAALAYVRRVPVDHTTPKTEGAFRFRAEIADRLFERLQATARFALRCYMELLSVKFTQQRWADGVEYALWRAVRGPRAQLADIEAERLRDLAAEAGGWYAVTAISDEPEFVAIADWTAQYADWAAET